jgi:hypothetical protein
MTKHLQIMVHLVTRVGCVLLRFVFWIYLGKPRETKEISFAYIAGFKASLAGLNHETLKLCTVKKQRT